MRFAHDRDWDKGPPYSGDDPRPSEDPGRCLFYIRLPGLQADGDGNIQQAIGAVFNGQTAALVLNHPIILALACDGQASAPYDDAAVVAIVTAQGHGLAVQIQRERAGAPSSYSITMPLSA